VLREAFTYPYREIGDLLSVEEVNARQIVSRARARVTRQRLRPSSAVECRRLLHAFVAAAKTGELAGLERLLASCATATVTERGLTRSLTA
jgi:RNA polymerase sigma-70 factor (ECF subfamily)